MTRPAAAHSRLSAVAIALALLAACAREAPAPVGKGEAQAGAQARHARGGQVTIHGDDRIAASLTWQLPAVELAPGTREATLRRAAKALDAGRLYDDAASAIPLYLALLRADAADAEAQAGLQKALAALLAQGDAALAGADDNLDALRSAHRTAAVARTAAPKDPAVLAYLARVDVADRAWDLNHAAEQDLQAGRLGESGDGALARLREVLRLRPGQGRAEQGLAAVESALIRRAETAGARGDFKAANGWLGLADKVRP
ncbi:MAG: formylglycine-generating enzyme family protein, partial [Lysobacter sp.]|nr:formylglycine-generating enzyme family protein [Lysobacter sp.]